MKIKYLRYTILFKWLLSFITLWLFFVLNIFLGSVQIPFLEIVSVLLEVESADPTWRNIIWEIRFPRAVTAVLAGSALALSGLQMQTLFRNPLAGPSILGITSGASLGVALVILGSGSAIGIFSLQNWGVWGTWLLVLFAVLGAVLVMTLVLIIALWVKDNVVLLIIGMMLGNLTSALVGLWQYFSSPEQVQDYLLWTFGSLGGVSLVQLQVLAISVLFGIVVSFSLVKPLNALLLGENYAQSMGLNIIYTRAVIILITSVLAGSVTAFCGLIGFVGIAVPHLCRAWFKTSNHLILIPASILLGAIMMLFCDIIAKLPGTSLTLPINSVTSLIGSPVVIWVIIRSKNLRRGF